MIMPDTVSRDESVTIMCPECKTKSDQKISDIDECKASCPSCGQELFGDEFANKVNESLERSIKKVRKYTSRLK